MSALVVLQCVLQCVSQLVSALVVLMGWPGGGSCLRSKVYQTSTLSFLFENKPPPQIMAIRSTSHVGRLWCKRDGVRCKRDGVRCKRNGVNICTPRRREVVEFPSRLDTQNTQTPFY